MYIINTNYKYIMEEKIYNVVSDNLHLFAELLNTSYEAANLIVYCLIIPGIFSVMLYQIIKNLKK